MSKIDNTWPSGARDRIGADAEGADVDKGNSKPSPKDVFLCHNEADKAWAAKLGARLEAESIDGTSSGRRISVFLDIWDIEGGDNFVRKLGETLQQARFVAAITSPEFFHADWTSFEWSDVVASDPSGKSGRLLPILLRDVSNNGTERIRYPAPFKALHRYDFRQKSRFETEFEKLLRRIRGQPLVRGPAIPARYSSTTTSALDKATDACHPDQVKDLLLGNLLQVRRIPDEVWSAKTEEPDGAAIWERIPTAPLVMIKARRLWTFANLENEASPLRAIIDTTTIQSAPTTVWRADSEKRLWLMQLLNKCLVQHLSKLALKKDRKGRFFFRPQKSVETEEKLDRMWQSGEDRPRLVAAKKLNASTGETFWVHHAATIKFRWLGGFFLSIEPTYLFTSNGEAPLEGDSMGRLSVMWGGRQRNPDILRNLVFWAKAIARSERDFSIDTGGPQMLVSGLPATALANVGIEADHVRVGALLRTEENELDELAQDVEFLPTEDDDSGYEDESECAGETETREGPTPTGNRETRAEARWDEPAVRSAQEGH